MFTVSGCGEVAFPPEIKQGRSGDYLTFKVRSGKVIKDRQTGQERTVQAYTRCVFFGDRGLAFAKRIEQGTIVEVRGELDSRRDDNGKEWTSVRVSHAGLPAEDAKQQPKGGGSWGAPSAQPQYAQSNPPQAQGTQQQGQSSPPQAQPAQHQYAQPPQPQAQQYQQQRPQPPQQQTPPPQYAQASLAPQGNPYKDDDIPF